MAPIESDLPERLKRLNRDLKTQATKRSDTVYATRRDHRIPVEITRRSNTAKYYESEKDFYAVAEFDGKRIFSYGTWPSHAFTRVVHELEWLISKVDYDRNISNSDNVVSLAERQAA